MRLGFVLAVVLVTHALLGNISSATTSNDQVYRSQMTQVDNIGRRLRGDGDSDPSNNAVDEERIFGKLKNLKDKLAPSQQAKEAAKLKKAEKVKKAAEAKKAAQAKQLEDTPEYIFKQMMDDGETVKSLYKKLELEEKASLAWSTGRFDWYLSSEEYLIYRAFEKFVTLYKRGEIVM